MRETPLKRYLIFAGKRFYPYGGWDDFLSDHDTAEEAHTAAMRSGLDWADIIDTETRTKASCQPN